MRIFLTSAHYDLYVPYALNPPAWLQSRSASKDPICTDNPELADIIIFVESHPSEDPYFRKIFSNPIYKKYKRKCVLYHDADLSITTLPTISPSIESWQYDPKHKRSFHYIARFTENETIDLADVTYGTERNYLYSFIGSRTHAVRNQILNIKHPKDVFIKDTTGINAWELGEQKKAAYEREYFDIMNKSSFILAPRGIGPCSYRLFETMQIGRVPVIISDSWVKIPGIDWDKFTITIPESKIDLIPAILRERENDAVEMGMQARKAWETYFSPDVSLQQIALAAKELLQHHYTIKDSLKDYSQFLRSGWHLKNFLRYKKNQLKTIVPPKTIIPQSQPREQLV